MDWLKKNWVPVLMAVVAALSGVDVAAGLSQGKALLNVSNLPSLGVGGSSLAMLFLRWFNNRAVTTRTITPGLDSDTTQLIESLFIAASHQDVTPEMAEELGNMAAAAVVGHAARVKGVV